jgi:hypothetical protein
VDPDERKEIEREREREARRREEALERAREEQREREREEERRAEALARAREIDLAEQRRRERLESLLAQRRRERRSAARLEEAREQRRDTARNALREQQRATALRDARREQVQAEAREARRSASREAQRRAARREEQRSAERAAEREEQMRDQARAEASERQRSNRLENERAEARRQALTAERRARQSDEESRGEALRERREAERADTLRTERLDARREEARAAARDAERAEARRSRAVAERRVERVAAGTPQRASGPLAVRGRQLVDQGGRVAVLRGVTLKGLERAAPLGGTFVSPVADQDLETLGSWEVTAVLVPIAQDLALYGRGAATGEDYLRVLDETIERAEAAGLYVVVELSQLSSVLPTQVVGGADIYRPPLPDLDSLDLWGLLARRYRQRPSVIFGLFRSPTTPGVADSTGALVERLEWPLWRRWLRALVGAVRRDHPGALLVARGLDGGRDVSGFPLRHTNGSLVPGVVHAGSLEGGGPGTLAALQRLARRTQVCALDWSPGFGEALAANATAARLARAGCHWFASSWRFGSQPLVTAKSGRLVPTSTGHAVRQGLAQPHAPEVHQDTPTGRLPVPRPRSPYSSQDVLPGGVAIGPEGAQPPRGDPNSTQFEHATLTTSRAEMRRQLEEYIAARERGEDAAQAFVARFAEEVRRSEQRSRVIAGTPDPLVLLGVERDRKILKLLEEELPAIREDNANFLEMFEVHATALIERLLRSNAQVAQFERYRFGLEEHTREVTGQHHDEFGVPYTETTIEYSYSMAETDDTRRLARIAGTLADAAVGIRTRVGAYNEKYPWEWASSGYPFPPELRAELESLWVLVEAARRDYDAMLLDPAVQEFPVLASFTRLEEVSMGGTRRLDELIATLRTIALAPSAAAAQPLYREVAAKLENNDDVRDALADGDLSVFTLDAIVELTEEQLGVLPGTLRARVVSDRVTEVRGEKEVRRLALDLVIVGLGLLASPLTAGASLGVAGAFIATTALIGSLGITAWTTAEKVGEYRLQAAMAGTHFDRAQALSQEDPSLAWLAFEIVGAAIDVVDVFDVFKAVAPLVRRSIALRRIAQTPGELAAARKALDEVAETADAKSAGLGTAVRSKAEAVAVKQAGELGEATTRWKQSLDPATKTMLTKDQPLLETFERMDPEVRAVLTRCGG